MMSKFKSHGYVTISNWGGYLVQISDCGESARIKDSFGSENPVTSDWLEIEEFLDHETGEIESIIDPTGYNINLNTVMKIPN